VTKFKKVKGIKKVWMKGKKRGEGGGRRDLGWTSHSVSQQILSLCNRFICSSAEEH